MRSRRIGGGMIIVDGRPILEPPRACRTYFGYKGRVAPSVLRCVCPTGTFIEAFCGGSSLSWLMHMLGRSTVSGDASFLGFLHAAGQVVPHPGDRSWPELPDDAAADGFASSLVRGEGPRQHGKFPLTREAAAWVDWVCITHREDRRILLSVGKALDGMRASHFPCWTNRPIERAEVSATVARWRVEIQAGIRNEDVRAEAHHCLAHELIKVREDWSGATLYLDPAWPFANGATAATYYDHPARIGDICAQREIRFSFLHTDEHLDYITDDVISPFFMRGGARVLLATQSTNSPEPATVAARLVSRWRVIDKVEKLVEGGMHRTGFREFMFVIEEATR